MVIVEHSVDGAVSRIQARSNFSLGAGGLLTLLFALAAVTLGLSAVLAWQGYWPILAIAGVQLALIMGVLVRAWQNAWVVEEIRVDEDRVHIRRRHHRQLREFSLPAAWAGVRMEAPRYPGHAARLVVGSGRNWLEIGKHLMEEEKMSLAKSLAQALTGVTAWR